MQGHGALANRAEEATGVTQSWHRAGLWGGGPLCTVIAIHDRKGAVDPSGHRTTGKHLLKATCGKSY